MTFIFIYISIMDHPHLIHVYITARLNLLHPSKMNDLENLFQFTKWTNLQPPLSHSCTFSTHPQLYHNLLGSINTNCFNSSHVKNTSNKDIFFHQTKINQRTRKNQTTGSSIIKWHPNHPTFPSATILYIKSSNFPISH